MHLDRRSLVTLGLALAAALPVRARDEPFAARLRNGACALLLRHAQTEPGVGDPPGFRLDACNTQRNLSEAGRSQAQKIGRWLRERNLKPDAVRTSAWCRCVDTAQLAFGAATVWPALNSFFDGRASEPVQTAQLREALARLAPGKFEVWVTHQVNITALTGEGVAMGEGLVVDTRGTILFRSLFD